ncbi:1266_t:CDS:2, partial [Scutellospora calospora]
YIQKYKQKRRKYIKCKELINDLLRVAYTYVQQYTKIQLSKKNILKQARLAFKIPNRKKLFTKLLDYIFNETKHDIEKLINKYTNMYLITDTHLTNETYQNREAIANNLEKAIIEIGNKVNLLDLTDNDSGKEDYSNFEKISKEMDNDETDSEEANSEETDSEIG